MVAFTELRPPLTDAAAFAEATRCLQCGGPEAEAPCVTACPADVDVPSFITAIAERDPDDAAATVFAENLLSGTCARVCPVELLCEGACVLEREGRRPVAIGALHRHAADWGLAGGVPVRRPRSERPGRVAVLGAGPAGLACAGELAARGYQVTVYDGRPEPGGLVRYAIAPYRQLNEPLPAEAQLVAGLGVELRFGAAIGSKAALRRIEREVDAIFLGVGMGADVDAGLANDDLDGVWRSLPFIEAVKDGRLSECGRRVVVIGGGNTAVDAARIALRLGAELATIVYRRTEAEMPAYAHEVAEARAEGVRFVWLTAPTGFVGDGHVEFAECVRMRLGRPGADGRARVEPTPDSDFLMPADTVVMAIGQQPRSDLFSWIGRLAVEAGRPLVDPVTAQTTNPKYFAGGDAVNGGATAVEAVRWGKLAALGIDSYLQGAGRAAA